jgi:glycine dehydrogenase subunit 1
VKLADALASVNGLEVLNRSFFNEFTVRLATPAAEVAERLAAKGVLAGVPVSRLLSGAGLDDLLLVASTEVNTDADRAALVAGLKEVL